MTKQELKERAEAQADLPLIDVYAVAYANGVHPATIWRKVKAGTFPQPRRFAGLPPRWRRAEVTPAAS